MFPQVVHLIGVVIAGVSFVLLIVAAPAAWAGVVGGIDIPAAGNSTTRLSFAGEMTLWRIRSTATIASTAVKSDSSLKEQFGEKNAEKPFCADAEGNPDDTGPTQGDALAALQAAQALLILSILSASVQTALGGVYAFGPFRGLRVVPVVSGMATILLNLATYISLIRVGTMCPAGPCENGRQIFGLDKRADMDCEIRSGPWVHIAGFFAALTATLLLCVCRSERSATPPQRRASMAAMGMSRSKRYEETEQPAVRLEFSQDELQVEAEEEEQSPDDRNQRHF